MRDFLKLLFVALELSALVAGLVTGGPILNGLRVVAVIVAALLGALLLFVVGVFAFALVSSRQGR